MNDREGSLISRIQDARRLLLAGQAREALEELRVVEAEGFATGHLVRAECLYALHQYSDAKIESARALELAPNSPRAEILLELVQEMVELDRMVAGSGYRIPGPGKEVLEEISFVPHTPHPAPGPSWAMARTPEPGLVSETLAEIMTRQGRYEEALKIYIQLSRMSPERDEYFHQRIREMEARIERVVSNE